jgi:general stress protein 26
MTVGAEDMSIRFATSVRTRKVKQIELNAEVHLTCGISDPPDEHDAIPADSRKSEIQR